MTDNVPLIFTILSNNICIFVKQATGVIETLWTRIDELKMKYLVFQVLAFLMSLKESLPLCRMEQWIPTDGSPILIKSPNYPGSYQPGAECTWDLNTKTGYRLRLNCDMQLDFDWKIGKCRDILRLHEMIPGFSGISEDHCESFIAKSEFHSLTMDLTASPQSRNGRFKCTVTAVCDCGVPKWSRRIAGGDNTEVNEFPMMSLLFNIEKNFRHCGATIISDRYLVTAAHCVDGVSIDTLKVVVGEHDLSREDETDATKSYKVKGFHIHPAWSTTTWNNDIALVRVDQPIEQRVEVGPACLPFQNDQVPRLNGKVTVSGWGLTSTAGPAVDILQKAEVQVVQPETCLNRFPTKFNRTGQFCTHTPGKDSCQYDSGGPLLLLDGSLQRYMLAGCVSYGGSCGEEGSNTRVFAYLDWIKETTGEIFCMKYNSNDLSNKSTNETKNRIFTFN